MKKLLLIFPLIALMFAACNDDENDIDKYTEWMELNDEWVTAQGELRNPDN